MNSMMIKKGAIGTAVLVAASAITGVISLGTYGYFRDKGWGSWKSGATSGAIGGLLASGYILALAAYKGAFSGLEIEQLNGLTIDPMPSSIAGLTISKLSGLPQINGMGLDDFQLGAIGVHPATLQTIGYMAGAHPQLGMLDDMVVY